MCLRILHLPREKGIGCSESSVLPKELFVLRSEVDVAPRLSPQFVYPSEDGMGVIPTEATSIVRPCEASSYDYRPPYVDDERVPILVE